MLQSAKWVADKFQEFVKRINALEDESEDTKDDVKDLRRDLEFTRKEMQHSDKVNKSVQDHWALKTVELEQRIKKLESEKHGAKSSAGRAKKEAIIAKQELEKVKRELKASKELKKRH